MIFCEGTLDDPHDLIPIDTSEGIVLYESGIFCPRCEDIRKKKEAA